MGRMLENEILENALQSIKIAKNSILDEVLIIFLEELKQYREIGTLEECKQAVERMKAKKPELFGDGYADGEPVYDFYRCPSCQEEYEMEFEQHIYCPNCGQHLDWSKGE